MSDLLLTSPRPPTNWDYGSDDHIVATAVSRETWRFWTRWTLEPEVGIAQRFGRQDATEVWGALFFRYHGFPWDDVLVTTAAVSTGLNWASEVTEVEAGPGRRRRRAASGCTSSRPRSPSRCRAGPDTELLFRFHHRSGVFGLVSDAWGGAQYATVGVRVRF